LNIIAQVIERGLKNAGRLGRLSVVVQDKPGTLNEITRLLAQMKSNILSVYHERNAPDLSHGLAEVHLLIETRGLKHLEQIHSTLKKCRNVSLGRVHLKNELMENKEKSIIEERG